MRNGALLVCPGVKPAGRVFQRIAPLVLLPVFGRRLLDRVLEKLSGEGVESVVIVSVDRPGEVNDALKEVHSWGLDVSVCSVEEELDSEECLHRFRHLFPSESDIRVVSLEDCHGLPATLPGDIHLANHRFFEEAFGQPTVVGGLTMEEISPGVWVSHNAFVHPSAILEAPTWIGPGAQVGAEASVGPCSVIESGAFIDCDAMILESWVGPDTYVGRGAKLRQSHVWGNGVSRWIDGLFLEIGDRHILQDLGQQRNVAKIDGVTRLVALLIWMAWAPQVAFAAVMKRKAGEQLFVERNVLLPVPGRSCFPEKTTRLKRLDGIQGPLSRWPELLEVVRGRMTLIGMRPRSLGQVSGLRGEAAAVWQSHAAAVFSPEEVDRRNLECTGKELKPDGSVRGKFYLLLDCVGLRKQVPATEKNILRPPNNRSLENS